MVVINTSSGIDNILLGNGTWIQGVDDITQFIMDVLPDASDPAETVTIYFSKDEFRTYATATAYVVPATGPVITTISPAAWWASKDVDITITGAGFFTSSDTGGPSQVSAAATGVTLSNVQIVSATQITAHVSVDKDAPAETVTLTVTNPSSSSSSHPATANPPPVVLPVPEIDWLGKKISGNRARTQKVKVGQPVELTTTPLTLPGGFTVSKSMWDVPGTSIKKFNEDDDDGISVDVTDLDTVSTNFYWLYPETGLNVTYEYCATGSDLTQYCTSPQVMATFEATEPNITLTTTEPYGEGKVNYLAVCGQRAKLAHMFYGDLNYPPGVCSGPYVGLPGINLTASGASGGKYMFVQVLKSDTLTWNGPTPYSCGPYEVALDGHYPFRGVYPNALSVAYDGPGMSLPNKYTSGKRDFDATMYLLWKPDQLSATSTASIPVPIGRQEWHFVATTDQKRPVGSGKWKKPDTTAHGDNGGYQASRATDNDLYGYPFWSGVSQISSCNPE